MGWLKNAPPSFGAGHFPLNLTLQGAHVARSGQLRAATGPALSAPNGSLDDITHAVAGDPLPSRTPATLDTRTWGRSAAHVAAITWLRPYRVLIHPDLLLPD